MTTFEDGPAKGVVLQLQRAPLFLRAVQSVEGEWDALDQLSDEPGPEETVVVYRRDGNAGSIHLHGTRKGKRWGSWYATASYLVLADQPGDECVRSTEAWRAWCNEMAAKQEAKTS